MTKFTIAESDDAGGYLTTAYDLETWSRWPEVVAYAERHQLSYGDAIQSLVNSGLSHQTMAPYDSDDPESVAQYIEDQTPDDVTSTRKNQGWDGDCWILSDGVNRFAIGVDQIDGGGLTWCAYVIAGAGTDLEDWDAIDHGGWAYGDIETADREIRGAIALFDKA